MNTKLNDKKIVQSNELIKSVSNMDRMPLKIFEIIVGMLDSTATDTQRTIKVNQDVILSILDETDNKDRYHRLREQLLKLANDSHFLFEKGEKHMIVMPISQIKWDETKRDVEFTFTNEILPYIQHLKKNFTQYKLSDVAKLSSKASIVIYKLMAMNYNQYRYYANGKQRTKEQLDVYRNPVYTVEELRYITNTISKYRNGINMYDKKVLKVAVDDINENTNFHITYDKVKEGRKISKIAFHIEYNSDDKIIPIEPFKTEEIEQYEQLQTDGYTKDLIDIGILEANDVTDVEFLTQLRTHVYPMYEQFQKTWGQDELKRHLNYISRIYKTNRVPKERTLTYLKDEINSFMNKKKHLTNAKRRPIIVKEQLPDWVGKENEPRDFLNENERQNMDNKIKELLSK